MTPEDGQRRDLIEEVTAWARHEKPSLEPWVVRSRSRLFPLAVVSQVVLVLYFIWEVRVSSRRRTIRRNVATPLRVDEIAYKVIEETLPEDRLERVSELDTVPPQEQLQRQQEPAPQGDSTRTLPPDSSLSPEEGQLFLDELRKRTEEQGQRLKSDGEIVRLQQKVVFGCLVASAGVTFVLAVVGILLIFAGAAAVGVVAEAIGLLPGIGTVLLTKTNRQLNRERERLRASEQDSVDLLRAITLTWAIPNHVDRSKAVAKLANDLAHRALNANQVRKEPND